MLRLRSESGKTITMNEPLVYVEVLDSKEDVAMVFHKDRIGNSDTVNLITKESEGANTYSKIYGVDWSKNLKTDWVSEAPLDFKKS